MSFMVLVFVGLGMMMPAMAQLKEVSFYEVRRTQHPPVIDGRLNDKAWAQAKVHDAYYEYWKADPERSPLKTECRMLYDDRGIYLSIVNYGKTDNLKKNIRDHDNPDLWTDTCAEIYFDPEANGIGYTKFTGNANGARADCRRQDLSVMLDEWSGYSWQLKSSVEPDKWILEAFFPWCDLGKTAQPGDLWQFCHARFDWHPKFVGASSAPGGNYNSTDLFNWIYFSRNSQPLQAREIAELLKNKLGVAWYLIWQDYMIGFEQDGALLQKSLLDMRQSLMQDCQRLLAEIRREKPSGQHEQKLHGLEQRRQGNLTLRQCQQLYLDINGLKWSIILNRRFN